MTDLDKASDNNRAALVVFGPEASLKARLGQYETYKLSEVLEKLPKMNGRTSIDLALKVAKDEIFPNARHGVYKMAIILTDGVQTDKTKGLRQSSKQLRDAGVRVIVVGIGVPKEDSKLRLMTDRNEDVVDAENIQGHLQKILCGCSKYQ